MTLHGWDTSPSQVNSHRIPNFRWVDWDKVDKMPFVREQNKSSTGHSGA